MRSPLGVLLKLHSHQEVACEGVQLFCGSGCYKLLVDVPKGIPHL